MIPISANINMNKLDSAFDIDPLFHKMSKTFDEGGAKGLLLVNLSIGEKGCNIVFDSKAEECANEEMNEEANEGRSEGMVNISSLVAKLDSIEAEQSIESMALVPQLASLRDQYSQLEAEGFVEQRKKPSKRYASTQQEENEADKSIHQEAIERSRVSAAGLGRSFATQDDVADDNDEAPAFAPDDFGGGNDYFDDDNDAGFDAFIALDDNGERFSSISFRESFAPDPETKTQADVLLDTICSGDVLGRAGEYKFFDTQALEMSMSENQWAGSSHFSFSHWKRSEPAHKRQEKAKTKKTSRPKKKKFAAIVDLTARPVLEDILRKPPKGKRGSNPLQMSKTMIATKTKEDHLLPYDTGVGVEKLSSLFLRKAVVPVEKEKASIKNKTVCFDVGVDTFGGGNDAGFEDSFGADDDGPGFVFADDDTGDGAENINTNGDDFVMEELKNVRKVDTKNVQVGYATIAKKVDVRRLKRDLWTGIEASIVTDTMVSDADDGDDSQDESHADGLSFQETVRGMEERKTQVDVTLPFYFICVLHLANEKGLKLESRGLEDFVIRNDLNVTAPAV